MPVWEIIGWTGSALVVISLVIPSIRKFRTLNLVGSLIATVYNITFGIWPYAAMNAVITIIDIYWLIRLHKGAKQEYRILSVDPESEIVADFVKRHETSMSENFPRFSKEQLPGASVYLTMCGNELVGLFAHEAGGEGARVLVDFVTERHRDLKPGKVLYADSTVRRSAAPALIVDEGVAADPGYFRKMGFEPQGGALVRAIHE